jgi:hypothetical protein
VKISSKLVRKEMGINDNMATFDIGICVVQLDKSILKEAYSSVVALLLEASKFDAETTSLR